MMSHAVLHETAELPVRVGIKHGRLFARMSLILAVLFGLTALPAIAAAREVVIIGTFQTPAGTQEEIVYETNAEYFGCKGELPGLKISMQTQVQGYEETRGWMLQDARCAFQTKDGAIEEFGTQ